MAVSLAPSTKGSLARRRNRGVVLALALLGLSGSGALASEWRVSSVVPSALPEAMLHEPGAPAPGPDALPDGRLAEGPASGDILAAWYAEPTSRYAHAVLGDAIEAGALAARGPAGAVHRVSLPDAYVFEDRTPRIADLDGDGRSEIIAIRASRTAGAALTLYGLAADGERLELRAETAPIGRANRWLNVAGIADYRGDGRLQIAIVRTPHIGGELSFYAYERGRLSALGALQGFSNHAIGARELRLSASADWTGDGAADLALPSADRRALKIVTLAPGGPALIAEIALPGRVEAALWLRERPDGASPEILLGFVGGGAAVVTPPAPTRD